MFFCSPLLPRSLEDNVDDSKPDPKQRGENRAKRTIQCGPLECWTLAYHPNSDIVATGASTGMNAEAFFASFLASLHYHARQNTLCSFFRHAYRRCKSVGRCPRREAGVLCCRKRWFLVVVSRRWGWERWRQVRHERRILARRPPARCRNFWRGSACVRHGDRQNDVQTFQAHER